MMMIKIEFLQFNEPKPNGDRATHLTDCYTFKVMLNDFVAYTSTQFNSFHCHVESYDEVFRQARKYADDLADTLKVTRPELVTMIKKVIHEEKWVPEVPASIAGTPGHREHRDNG